MYSNDSRSVKNLSSLFFYCSPTSLCTFYLFILSNKEFVSRFSIPFTTQCPSWAHHPPSKGNLPLTGSIEFPPKYRWGKEEGCSLHFKCWKHILRALLLSLLQFLRKTQQRKNFGRNPKVTFACLFQVMHMHACKTQALVASASGLRAMICTEIEAHLYKIAFKNSICQLHTLQMM